MENSSQNSVFIVTVMSTKGGVTKSTNMANISAFCADCGLRTLMIDTDVQPTLPTDYTFDYTAPQGLFKFLIQSNTNPDQSFQKPNIKISILSDLRSYGCNYNTFT